MTTTATKVPTTTPKATLRQLAVAAAGCSPNPLWVERARCASMPKDLFYGFVSELTLSVCRSCPVRVECLTEAISRPHEQGVWGGLTESERAEVAVMIENLR